MKSCEQSQITERDRRMVARIKEITAKGNNAEVRKKGEQYSVLEVSKKAYLI